MKKSLSVLLISVCILLSIIAGSSFYASALSSSGSCGDNVSYTFDSSTGLLTISGTGDMENYSGSTSSPFYRQSVIKSVVINSGVTSIGSSAFSYCSSLISINIPNSVTSIGSSAFSYCSSLTSINIPNSVTSIGNSAFSYCIKLTSINIPDSVTSIGKQAFYYCRKLTNINIPKSVASIGYYAFAYCDSLESMSVDKDNMVYDSRENSNAIIETASNKLISGCKNTVIPSSVTSIGDYAFYYCSSLTSINIPDSVTSIGDYAFYDCSSLTSINIPGSVTSIGSYAFSYCSSLTSINIPGSVTSIGSGAFRNCSSLTSINISNSVTSIGDYAFYGCSGLKELTLPCSAKIYNSENTFYNCTGIEKVTLTKGTGTMQNYGYSTSSNAKNTYYGYTPWYLSRETLKELIIEEGVTSIGDYAFYDCSGIKELTMPCSAKFYSNSFYNCTNVEEVTLTKGTGTMQDYGNSESSLYYHTPWYLSRETLKDLIIEDGITNIGDYAFYYCSSLTSINIPGSVTSIGDYSFYYCDSLTSISIPDSVTSIGRSAFSICSSLTSIEIPNSVTSIGRSAFYYCIGLTSIEIPESVTSIGRDAFGSCRSLKSINIPNGITNIADYTFFDCSSLTSINIPDSVTSIGDYAFYGCSGLKELALPCSAKIYNSENTFYNCTGIKKVTLTKGTGTMQNYGNSTSSNAKNTYYEYTPWYISRDICTKIIVEDGIKNLGDYAFYNCSSLTNITLPKSVTSIGNSAFCGCGSLKSIAIPDGVTSIGYNAFYRSGLKSVVIPEGVTVIRSSTFDYCSSLKSVTIPESITEIGQDAFYNCTSLNEVRISSINSWINIALKDEHSNPLYYAHNLYLNGNLLTNLKIPADLKNIGLYAFVNCSSLKSVSIGKNVESINKSAFEGCSSLEEITVDKGNKVYDSRKKCNAIIKTSNNKLIIGCKKTVIPSGVKTIGDYAFCNCSSLKTLTVPKSVTSIGREAFYFCSSLKSITLPSGITSIGDYAFDHCSSLESIELPGGITTIGYGTFRDCSSLKSIEIPNGVSYIDSDSFDYCSSLKSITIGNAVKVINYSSFSGCKKLKDVYYTGTEAQWKKINIEYGNDKLSNVSLHFNVKANISNAVVSGIKDKTYTGKNITQKITVKFGSKTLKEGKDYKASYKNNKAIGKATVTITGIKGYKGTIKETFCINPKSTSLTTPISSNKSKKQIYPKWKKVSGVTGYEFCIAEDKDFKENCKTANINKQSVSTVTVKVKPGRTYYMKVRTYKKVGSKKYYSSWSKTVTAKIKK